MHLALNHRRRSILRPLLFAAFAALAWLIWGAETANAALPDPDPEPQLTQAGTTTLEDASAGATPLPVPMHLPGSTLLPVPAAVIGTVSPVTATVTDSVSGTAANTTPTVDGGLAEVVDVVGSAVDPVQPVVTDIGDIVGGVAGIVPTAPLPGPDVVPPVLPEPLPSVPGVHLLGQEVPNDSQISEVPPAQPAAEAVAATVPTPSSQSGTSATQIADGIGTRQALLIPSALHTLEVMRAVSAPVPEAPAPGERRLQPALAAGPGSATTGSAGSGAPAWADVAAFWAVPLAARFAAMPSLQELPPVAPPFDPGSTPD